MQRLSAPVAGDPRQSRRVLAHSRGRDRRRQVRARAAIALARSSYSSHSVPQIALILLPEEPEDGSGGLNDQDYRYFMGSPLVQAHAEAALDIAVMPANVPGHAQIEVAHLVTPGDDF